MSSSASEQMVYELAVKVSGCAYDVRINDAPVIDDEEGYPTEFVTLVSEWVRNGGNEVSAWMVPAPSVGTFTDSTECTLVLYQKSGVEDGALRVEVLRREVFFKRDQPRLDEKGRIVVTGRFDADLRRADWAWLDGMTMVQGPELHEAVCAELVRFHKAFEEHDLKKVLELTEARDTEMASALGISVEENKKRTREIVLDAMNHPDFELQPVDCEDLSIRIYGNGRLAMPVDSAGDPPVYFLEKDGNYAKFFPVMFIKNEAGKLVVCR